MLFYVVRLESADLFVVKYMAYEHGLAQLTVPSAESQARAFESVDHHRATAPFLELLRHGRFGVVHHGRSTLPIIMRYSSIVPLTSMLSCEWTDRCGRIRTRSHQIRGDFLYQVLTVEMAAVSTLQPR